ncbi:GNAT family N-acetyltransferase [Aeromicrobium alkaliterrae]|uniref:GNAT family N-acetyltransferase n=1 Tax=Aeromicrobium alkaliterrae TaxID=302168 RepID=A0ABP4WFA2_9ACTN
MDTSGVRPPGSEVVGRRVSVRHRTQDGGASDVVGRVLATAPELRLERRDGSVGVVDPATVLIWRVVPDRPVRARRATATPVDQLSRIMARGWPAIESVDLGAWELRASGGFTKRANSAGAVGDPDTGLDEALDRVRAFYADRGQRPLVQLEAGGPWEQPLLDRGWTPVAGGDTSVLVAQLDRRWPLDPEAEVAAHPDAAWIEAYASPGESTDLARQVLTASPNAAHVRLDGAVARVVVTGEWAGLSALWVPEVQRRRGLARRLVTTCLGWAVEQGADKAYLQVEVGNDPAERLYRAFGFLDHHEYRYLTFTGTAQSTP